MKIAGYEIHNQLYEGSRSVVYRARRTQDDLPVILKMLQGDVPLPEELARFRREYEITRAVNIEGAIDVYGLESSKNSPVIVLEDFGGESLTLLLRDRTPDIEECLRLAIRITSIVEAIHHHNIIHKDLNPSNIVWNPNTDQLKLIDCGISTELSNKRPEIRHPNVLEGTLAYMSPEQTGRMNRSVDYRTDLYSLGVVLYELFPQRRPFNEDEPLELVHAHIARTPHPPAELKPEIPGALSDCILTLLAKNAKDRYQSAFGVRCDLEDLETRLHCYSDDQKCSYPSCFLPKHGSLALSYPLKVGLLMKPELNGSGHNHTFCSGPSALQGSSATKST